MSAQPKIFPNESDLVFIDSQWKNLYKLGGLAALILLAYSLVTMVILVVIGGQPETAQQGFTLIQNNRLVAFLRLDGLTIFIMPLYYLLFVGFYSSLNKTQSAYAGLAAVLGMAGVTLFLATPSAFSWLVLSDKFAAAASAEQRTLLLAAGEAILAADMWHGSGALVGGLLLQASLVLISGVMLGSKAFSKSTAYLGLGMHSLDFAHLVLGFFFPTGGVILMAIAGPLYLVWFPLLARDFFRLGRSEVSRRSLT